MRTKIIVASLAALAVAFAAGVGSADSSDCDYADPAAPVGSAQSGDPASGEGSLTVCVAGLGSLEVGGDANAQEGYVHADGDEANESIHECLDGFIRAEADSEGNTVFYSGPDGDWKDTNGSAEGSPDAEPKTLEEVLADLQADCAPA